MNKSESIASLAAALVAAQGEMPSVKENAVNPFLKNKFANLDGMIETVKPVLKAHGLAVMQLPRLGSNYVEVETLLLHSSGEWLSETFALPVGEEKGLSQAQSIGKLVTYARRYAMSAMLRLSTGEDADGNTGVLASTKTVSEEAREVLDDLPGASHLGPGVRVPSHEHWSKNSGAMMNYTLNQQELGLTDADCLAALNVEHLSEYKGTLLEAKAKLKEWKGLHQKKVAA